MLLLVPEDIDRSKTIKLNSRARRSPCPSLRRRMLSCFALCKNAGIDPEKDINHCLADARGGRFGS